MVRGRGAVVLLQVGLVLVVVGLLRDQSFTAWLGSALVIVGCFADRAADIALGTLRLRLTAQEARASRRGWRDRTRSPRTTRRSRALEARRLRKR